jgi:hypothetical protein
MKRPSAERPCDPTTIRSGFHSSALLRIAEAGDPAIASARTSHAGKIVCKRRLAAIARLRAPSTGAGNCAAAAVRTGLNVADGVGSHNSATVTTIVSTMPGRPARFKSSSAASAQAEPSYAMSAFILAAINTPFHPD